jgi:hypothetical protein
VEELGIPDLTTEQIEMLCSTAENAARKHVLSKVPSKMVEMKNFDAATLAKEAIREALKASENYLRKLK